MIQLMNRINEIEELKEKYHLKSHQVFALQTAAIFEEHNMDYEKLKELFIQ